MSTKNKNSQHHHHSGGSKSSSSSSSVPHGAALVGRYISKCFFVPHHQQQQQQNNNNNSSTKKRKKFYQGKILSYNAERDLYHIYYAEDGDEEEMEWAELQTLLLLMEDDKTVAAATTTTTTTAAKLQVVTPQSDNSDNDDNISMDLDDDDSYDEDDNDDDDDDSFSVEAAATTAKDKKPPAKRTRTSTRKSVQRRIKNQKKESSNTTRSRSPKKKTLFPVKTTTTGMSSNNNNSNSVAVRGLPQGARAIGVGGFEIRTLDGIAPLLTKESVQKAVQFVATGQHHAAARLLRTDHDSIRAFCQVACQKLGIVTGTTTITTCSTTTSEVATLLEGGSALSERARARLQEGLQSTDADLPGRLLVVRTGTVLQQNNDNSSGDEDPAMDSCMDNVDDSLLIDRVFASAAELHQRTGIRVATYAMTTTSDPAFGPWSVLHQRLETAGLWSLNENTTESSMSTEKRPFVVTVEWSGNENDLPVGSWQVFRQDNEYATQPLLWGLIEGATRDAPPVILGVSTSLIASGSQDVKSTATANDGSENGVDSDIASENVQSTDSVPVTTDSSSGLLLPPLSREVAQVRLPASLLQKAIRRNFCSPAPLLQACRWLLQGNNESQSSSSSSSSKSEPPRGGVYEMLRTTWRCMLEDASPFDAPDDGSLLGLEELLLLSLIAMADPFWRMPASLCRKAVAAALRTQKQCADFTNIEKTVDNGEENWKLQDTCPLQGQDGRAVHLQNALLIMRAAIGGKFVQRSFLKKADPVQDDETAVLDAFEQGMEPSLKDPRLQRLDNECRLAAYDHYIAPTGLLVLQATLSDPPTSWKKHSLPALSRQVCKLITEANARLPDHHRLTRLAAWGRNSDTGSLTSVHQGNKTDEKQFSSAREVVTSTGKLSEKEHEIIDCFEAVQRLREKEKMQQLKSPNQSLGAQTATVGKANEWKSRRAEAGAAPSEYDGRIAFLLAFAKAEEIEVHPEGGAVEVVNVLFCGDPDEPLLVQRIGKSREQAAAKMQGPESGSSGAKAVPSLGYVQRSHSKSDRLLAEAAEHAVAQRWKGGRIAPLPLPPAGFQWNLKDTQEGQEELQEQAVKLTATLDDNGSWNFSIGGVSVKPFDARNVISPCSLDTDNHRPLFLEGELKHLLSVAFYVNNESSPDAILNILAELHNRAVAARQHIPDEGQVYDWLPLATSGLISAHIWRDAILALKTREKDVVILGPVLADGTCKRDMTEGCLLRIFSALECLYPTALIKSAALKWRVRPRGAQYHHMLVCLEQLSCCAAASMKVSSIEKQLPNKGINDQETQRKRPVRRAAVACKEAVASLAMKEASGDLSSSQKKSKVEPATEGLWEEDYLPVPKVTTELWPHQEASVAKIISGVKEGRRGHADASAVGAGKTLTALATIVRLSEHLEASSIKRVGVLVMLPTKALVKEWLLQIAAHTSGFHVIEQREDGQLFSLTYGKSTPPPPIDGNTIVISTLDRVREHPFTRQAMWDFVVIDECLAIQNAAAKRCPSAWQQIEVSRLGVLMLSATFFRSKYADLFYMIRMLRTAFPRSMEWLSATIHEHIVCQVPETDRTWHLRGEPVPLPAADLKEYRCIIEAYRRKQLNGLGGAQDYRRLFTDLEVFLRRRYEGRESRDSYSQTSVMAEAFFKACDGLIKQGHRPLVFADTEHEAEHLLKVLRAGGLHACKWASLARDNVSGRAMKPSKRNVIVAVKSVEGQGINMQAHADAIVCRPTPGDHLEQMKGRIDRPGQASKKLILVVLMAEHTIEEAKYANIHLAGNFFREYIAPVAARYRERIDLEATLAAGGTAKLKRGTVSGAWRRSLEASGQSGAFARMDSSVAFDQDDEDDLETEANTKQKSTRSNEKAANHGNTKNKKQKVVRKDENDLNATEPAFAPRNKVLRNKGDPEAVRQAKKMAREGKASLAVRSWLFPPKKPRSKDLAKESLMRFSDATPPVVLDKETVHKAVAHLTNDPKLAALISRVGAEALIQDCGDPKAPTQAKLFNYCIRAITFTMVSVDAGNSFLRRLAIKIGVCIEMLESAKQKALLKETLEQMQEGTSEFDHLNTDELLNLLLAGKARDLLFTQNLLGALVETCLVHKGKQTGYPHLCGETYRCGKNDDHEVFLQKARDHAAGGDVPVSAGFSAAKAGFIISMVHDFECGKISAKKIARASDREAAKMLLGLKGIGDWCAGGVLMHFLKRGNIMLYGDLTVRNFLNDLYDINHSDESETMLDSAADFPDTGENRNLIDAISNANGWEPYRSVVCLLMYHLQEENLVLL